MDMRDKIRMGFICAFIVIISVISKGYVSFSTPVIICVMTEILLCPEVIRARYVNNRSKGFIIGAIAAISVATSIISSESEAILYTVLCTVIMLVYGFVKLRKA